MQNAPEPHMPWRGSVLGTRTNQPRTVAQLTEQTRSREYKSSDQRDHERKQHKVTQEHEHPYALFFISQSCPPKDLPSARFATLEPQNSERYLGTDLDIEWRASRGTA